MATSDQQSPMSEPWKAFKFIGILALVICILFIIGFFAKSREYQEPIIVGTKLHAYCMNGLKHTKENCDIWQQGILNTQYQKAKQCVESFDWTKQTNDFNYCLQTAGIKPPV